MQRKASCLPAPTQSIRGKEALSGRIPVFETAPKYSEAKKLLQYLGSKVSTREVCHVSGFVCDDKTARSWKETDRFYRVRICPFILIQLEKLHLHSGIPLGTL